VQPYPLRMVSGCQSTPKRYCRPIIFSALRLTPSGCAGAASPAAGAETAAVRIRLGPEASRLRSGRELARTNTPEIGEAR